MQISKTDKELLSRLKELKDDPAKADREIALIYEAPSAACVVTTYRDIYYVFEHILNRYSNGNIPERNQDQDSEKSDYQKLVDRVIDRTGARAGCGINDVQHAFIFFPPEKLLSTYRNMIASGIDVIELGKIGRGNYTPEQLDRMGKL
ncbi:TPA: hypothetical protein ACIBE3_002088 [Salmonella enterica subsp. enterica serovar Reading]